VLQDRPADSELRLAPPVETGLRLDDTPPPSVPRPTTLGDEAADQALDEMLEAPWPDEATDGDFGIPGEDEAGPAQAIDPDTEQILDDEFGDPEGADAELTEVGVVEEHGVGVPAHDEHDGGEHAGHGETSPLKVAATVANFLLWLGLVVWLGGKPVREFLENRRLAVEEGLEEAARLSEEARDKHAEYSARLDRLDEELEKLRQEMLQAGEAESARIVKEAEDRAARMRKDAKFVIDQRMKQLRVDLTREAVEAAVAAAEEVLRARVQAADQQRLADGYLTEIVASIDADPSGLEETGRGGAGEGGVQA